MENMVTMNLEDYDELRETTNSQKKRIEQLTRDRVEELKAIFQLDPSYNGAGIYIDATDIIKEIYGEEIEIKGAKHILAKERLTSQLYSVYKEVTEETKEEE